MGTGRHVSHLGDQKCDHFEEICRRGEAYRWRTIVDRLCSDAKLVRDALLKVVNIPVYIDFVLDVMKKMTMTKII